MSEESGKPWYKNPTYLTIIATMAAAIISSPIWRPIIFPPPADFSIAVDPMLGAVHQGGVTTTAITVKGIHGYEYSVSLSATGQPPGVVVTFIPPIGGPTPSYTSTVTITVDSNVPPSDYTIIIKGTGADGKERSCNYILTIKSMPVTPTPTPTLAPVVTIKITNPKEGAEVSSPLTVEGKLEGELPEDWYLWTFYYNYEEWYPQNRIVPFEGEWKSIVYLGSQTDVEKDVVVVLADKDADSEFQQGELLRILPQGAQVCDQITVIVSELHY